jgi:hypothetical protein
MRRKYKRVIIWSKELAYAVGLITTDGCLSNDNRHISITSTDYHLLKSVLVCLQKLSKITLNTPSIRSKKIPYHIQISDVALYDFLLKIGLFPNKSLTLSAINIPNKYFRDFLRGHLDGDGSIIYYKDHYNTKKNPKYIYDRLFVYFLSASKKHINWLFEKIKTITGLKGNLTERKYNKTIMYRIKFSTKQAKILLNWIYYKPGLPCLKRKYLIAKPFIKNN